MKSFKEKSFAERRNMAESARKEMLQRFQSKPAPDDPEVQARKAEREAIIKAREARAAAKAEAKRLEEERLAAEAAAREAAKRAAEEQALQEMMAREAEQKARRDARYAARKARKK